MSKHESWASYRALSVRAPSRCPVTPRIDHQLSDSQERLGNNRRDLPSVFLKSSSVKERAGSERQRARIAPLSPPRLSYWFLVSFSSIAYLRLVIARACSLAFSKDDLSLLLLILHPDLRSRSKRGGTLLNCNAGDVMWLAFGMETSTYSAPHWLAFMDSTHTFAECAEAPGSSCSVGPP